MKKRSIISILTASALVLGTVSIPVFADNTDPCLIFAEDFENYEVGTKLSEAGIGWTVKDSNSGDSVTIETDPTTNSKAVKITQTKQEPTKNANPTTGFILDGFGDKITSGIVDISFKMRREKAGALLPKDFLGIDNNYALLQSGSDIYFGRMVWDAKYWGGNAKDSYTTWNMTYDFENDKLQINSTNGGKINISHDPVGYSGIKFLISGNWGDGESSWVGGEDGVDPIYWIDDIKVSKRCVAVSDVALKGDKLTVTFNTPVAAASAVAANFAVQLDDVDAEGFTVAQDADDASKVIVTLPEIPEYDTVIKLTVKKGIAAVDTLYGDSVEDTVKSFTVEAETSILSENFNSYSSSAVDSKHSDWSVTTSGTGTVTVDTDSLTGSKAIKIVAEKENMSKTGIQIPFTKVTDGKVKVSFKLRDENDSLLFTNLSLNSGYSTQIAALKYRGTVYDKVGKWQESEFISMDGQYHDVNYILDFNTNTYSIVVDGVIKIKNRTLREPAGTGVDSLNVYVSANYNEFGADESWLPSKTGDGIYWIDDINVVKFNYPTIYSETVTNGASNVPVNSELKYTFDMDMNADSINKDNIKIYADNILVEDYSVSYADKVATVAVAGGLAYDTTYTVVVDSAVKSALMERMKKTVTYTFTTAENPEKFLSMQAVSLNDAPVEDISEFAGESIKVNATLNKNLSGYTFYAAIKDANGRLLSVSKVSSEDVSGTTATVTLSVPTGVTDTSVIEGFLFDTASQAPLSEKKTKKKP